MHFFLKRSYLARAERKILLAKKGIGDGILEFFISIDHFFLFFSSFLSLPTFFAAFFALFRHSKIDKSVRYSIWFDRKMFR